MASVHLFTVGYEQRTVSELLGALREAGARTLIDVRELPLSRRKGFSKTKLGEAAREAGLAYEHVRLLGNPKPYRQLYLTETQRPVLLPTVPTCATVPIPRSWSWSSGSTRASACCASSTSMNAATAP